jgi:uncharacterized protein YndB with AHSA1/START domain
MEQTTENSRDIKASADKIYQALTDPAALVKWQAPGSMNAQLHSFELGVRGGYQMSLFYPDNEDGVSAKTMKQEQYHRLKS